MRHHHRLLEPVTKELRPAAVTNTVGLRMVVQVPAGEEAMTLGRYQKREATASESTVVTPAQFRLSASTMIGRQRKPATQRLRKVHHSACPGLMLQMLSCDALRTELLSPSLITALVAVAKATGGFTQDTQHLEIGSVVDNSMGQAYGKSPCD